MEETTNQNSRVGARLKNCTQQSSNKSLRLTSSLKDTEKIKIVRHSENREGQERKNTDEIAVVRGKGTWSEDKVRQLLTICVLCLFVLYVLVGLIMYIISRNFALLVSSQVFDIPIYKVMSFYFYHPKEK